jgi:hypothetical protein
MNLSSEADRARVPYLTPAGGDTLLLISRARIHTSPPTPTAPAQGSTHPRHIQPKFQGLQMEKGGLQDW